MTNPWPTELRLHKDRKALTVAFDSGESFDLAAEYLRIRSPSAEVQGHSPSERRTVGGKEAVQILEVHPVGNYAVRLTFDDMHSTGIFSWEYLFELGQNRAKYWREYSDEPAGKGPFARTGGALTATVLGLRAYFYIFIAENFCKPRNSSVQPQPWFYRRA